MSYRRSALTEALALDAARRIQATGQVLEEWPYLQWLWEQPQGHRYTMTHRGNHHGGTYSCDFFDPTKGGWVVVGPDLRDIGTVARILEEVGHPADLMQAASVYGLLSTELADAVVDLLEAVDA